MSQSRAGTSPARIGRGQPGRPGIDGRKVPFLTARSDHLDNIRRGLEGHGLKPFVQHARMSKKQRAKLVAGLDALPTDRPRFLLASGRLAGEGFNRPLLNTLMLAMPVSSKRTLHQYVGRLHRDARGKDRRLPQVRSLRQQ